MKNIFTNYINNCPNSFDANFEEFDHDEPLFPHHILVNSKFQQIVNCCPIFRSSQGFFLKNDCIVSKVPETTPTSIKEYAIAKLKLSAWNRYYYTYKDGAKNGDYYLVYTKLGFEKIRSFVYEFSDDVGDEIFDASVIGAMTIFNRPFSGKENDAYTTILLSKRSLPSDRVRNVEEPSWSPDTLTITNLKNILTRGFTLALIHDLMKQTGYTISPEMRIDYGQLGGWKVWRERNATMSFDEVMKSDKYLMRERYEDVIYQIRTEKEQSEKFEQFIKDNYGTFSNDLKDICKYLYPKSYDYTPMSREQSCRYRDDKMTAYANIMTHFYESGVTNPIVLITSDKEAEEMNKFFESLINDVFKNKNKLSWLDDDGNVAMAYITGLLFANSFISPDNIQHKSIVAVWVFYMLYRNVQNCRDADKLLFHILLCHIIGTNNDVFAKLIDKIKTPTLYSNLSSAYCVGKIIDYYSNSFEFDEKKLSDIQRRYLGWIFHQNADYLAHYKEIVASAAIPINQNEEVSGKVLADALFNFLSEIIHRPNYTNKCIIDAIKDDFYFDLDNFIPFSIKEKYLPVRAMTSENMGILGDVAIVGCNPIKYTDLTGSVRMSSFEIIENESTEYFVFSQRSSLYDELVRKVLAMEAWIPNEYDYRTIKGWIYGEQKVVHIQKTLL